MDTAQKALRIHVTVALRVQHERWDQPVPQPVMARLFACEGANSAPQMRVSWSASFKIEVKFDRQ